MASSLNFRKMSGLGNDFVVLDARGTPLTLSEHAIRAIAAREGGIGCDQLLILEKPLADTDVFMRIYNADGSESGSCGNGARCIARLVMDEAKKSAVKIATIAGVISAVAAGDKVTVDMGKPRLQWNEIPLAEPFHDTRTIELQLGPIDAPLIHSPAVVNMGNPHAIFFVDDLNCVDLARAGPLLENHPLFPERANISLARVDAPDHITLKVWERGAGITKACGTAACAAAVAGVRKRLTLRHVIVTLPGGDLTIEWRTSDEHVLMTGPVTDEGGGVIPEWLLMERSHVD